MMTAVPASPQAAGPSNDSALNVASGDLRIEQRPDGGFHLFVRRKPGLGSVLLTESTRDPSLREDNFAYRAPDWNEYNGSERRLIDGLPLDPAIHSLIDSTPEVHPELGEAYHLYIPYILNYGYENTRHGETYVVDGTYFNIRAFAMPYADYRGRFLDNPFVLSVVQRQNETPVYMTETEAAFRGIAGRGGGILERSSGPADLAEKVRNILKQAQGPAVDLVLCLDTTASMKDDIEALRRLLIPAITETAAGFESFRVGLVLYKDYYEEYLNRTLPFTADMTALQRSLNAIQVRGGTDIPEAVYEALYAGATKFPWQAESRVMILIGDAPPHPRQRGSVSEAMVDQAMAERGIKVSAIILPQ